MNIFINFFSSFLLSFFAVQKFNKFIKTGFELLQLHVAYNDFRTLLRVLAVMQQIKQREAYADNLFKPLKDMMQLLKTYNVPYDGQLVRNIDQLPLQWQHLKALAITKAEALQDTKRHQQQRVTAIILLYTCHLQAFAKKFQKMPVRIKPSGELRAAQNENAIIFIYFLSLSRSLSISLSLSHFVVFSNALFASL